MTTYFVSAVDGNNADNGTTWTLAKQTVAGALAIAASNDIILVDSAGTFTATAAITWTAPAGNIAIISVNRAGGDVPLAGATESVGASSNAFSIPGVNGASIFVYGMVLNGGTNNSASCSISLLVTASATSFLYLKNCTLDLKGITSSSIFIILGATISSSNQSLSIRAEDCTFICSGSRAGNFISLRDASIEMINPTFSITGGTKPTGLFTAAAINNSPELSIRDGDISGYNVSASAYFVLTSMGRSRIKLENLKTSATPSLTSGSWPGGIGYIQLRNVDSGDTINSFEYYNAYGSLIENSSIYLTNGEQFAGANLSWQVTTTSLCSAFTPFQVPLFTIWNTNTSLQVATVELIRDNATPLTDQNAWLGIDFPASASFPNYTYNTDRNAAPFTGTPVNQTTSTVGWTGVGGFSNPTKQSLDVSLTAAEVGLLTGTVFLGIPSDVLYLNPYLS